MKRKTLICLTSLLLCTTMLSACKGANYKVAFNPYWQQDVDDVPETTYEQLVYDVTLTNQNSYSGYKMQYKDGTYTTTLRSKREDGKLLYEYTTRLDISVCYISGTFQSEWMNDYVQSTILFHSTANALAPISSHKELISHSPMNQQINAETDFEEWKYSCVVDVDYSTNQSTVTMNPATEKESVVVSEMKIDDKKYSYLDNEQLMLGLRALNPSTNSSTKVLVYSPFAKTTQTISATFDKKVTEENLSFEKDGQPYKADVQYYPVTIALEATNSGQKQTIWIAAAENVKNNLLRNVILRYETPITYGLGTLVYKLKSATFTNA